MFIEVQIGAKAAYSVALDPPVIDDEVYTWSRTPNRWSSLAEEDPRIVVRIGAALYRATAFKVDDDSLLARVN